MHDPQYDALANEIELLERVIRNEGDGPDFERIPEGFEPLAR